MSYFKPLAIGVALGLVGYYVIVHALVRHEYTTKGANGGGLK